ncbi:hypothetical protein Ddye_004418 [Dipteronia dyeriana]|uniref:Uncharacterized protein n=1 Tax=Dipteronia dyeriana TaxID=168575 RepID=A0AAE0CWD0_9ROSI|nr:hypothetical protein Ddye_004418 [Dipteronia dyeriana]
MRNYGLQPTPVTLSGLLSCDFLNICEGIQLQALAVKNGLLFVDSFLGTALSCLYSRHVCLSESVCAFEDMPRKSLVTFNSLISIFRQHGFAEYSMVLFREHVNEEAQLMTHERLIARFNPSVVLELGQPSTNMATSKSRNANNSNYNNSYQNQNQNQGRGRGNNNYLSGEGRYRGRGG